MGSFELFGAEIIHVYPIFKTFLSGFRGGVRLASKVARGRRGYWGGTRCTERVLRGTRGRAGVARGCRRIPGGRGVAGSWRRDRWPICDRLKAG